MAAKRKQKKTLSFSHHLVLNQWLFSLFGLDSLSGNVEHDGKEIPTLEAFCERFQLHGDTAGRDAEGQHALMASLCANLADDVTLSEAELLEYDRRIKTVTDSINDGRKANQLPAIEWKYFQYLTLLFTEIYLDWVFNRREQLVDALNAQIQRWNARWIDEVGLKYRPLELLDAEDNLWPQLNTVAYWSATGSGKTLIMHANILQFRYYLGRYGKKGDINKTILLTPNEGLTQQHLTEFAASGISATAFSPRAGELFDADVQVIDINKLREEEKDKTVAVASFGRNNLLLVDEGHRGTASGGGGVWYRYRRALCEHGFAFEYSATFAQSAISDTKNKDLGTSLRQTYTKAILFDYSYRHFYRDGYGKQSQVLNLDDASEQSHFLYQVASLLSFYQQLRLFADQKTQLAPFNLEKPLWVFVTSKVTSGFSKAEGNDMAEVLQFIDTVISDSSKTRDAISTLINQGLVGRGGVDTLHDRFNYLKEQGDSAADLYDDLLERVFHSGGGRLYMENITGVDGELALRAGATSEPFGVINVGDAGKLKNLCEEKGLLVQDARFAQSLFHGINQPGSPVNLLLGAKKFTEGWSSWRVSNMTLLNVGRNEGAQIIQLFGRGVRLKGWQTTLKRSSELQTRLKDAAIERPQHIGLLETLNIFGLKADYMDTFRRELAAEEIPVNDGLEEFTLPLEPMAQLPQDLNVIRLKPTVANKATGGAGTAFKELAEQVMLRAPGNLRANEKSYFYNPPRVSADFYPRVGQFATEDKTRRVDAQQQTLGPVHIALLDIRRLYFELLAFKRDKRWANLALTPEVVEQLLADTDWYTLYAPDAAMSLGQLENMALWHDMAIALLRKYCEMFYNLRRKQWESDKLEYRPITENRKYLPGVNDGKTDGRYTVTLDHQRQYSLVKQLKTLRKTLENQAPDKWDGKTLGGLEFIWCEPHLYQPLLAGEKPDFPVSPVALNSGEAAFASDVHKAVRDDFFAGYEVYLLRNQTGQGAVGLFIDGGFYPDFILWLVKDGRQKVIFVDPKGLRNHKLHDPKVQFYRTIKETERQLNQQPGGQHIELHAFLISRTPAQQLLSEWPEYEGQTLDRDILESWNILFPDDSRSYLKTLMANVETNEV
ncbi:DEAD/DEAH box helicase family protein [Vreelandella jeotgali]|uniref:DEAD/DEAH box helicase family protein n=1 Tax=Vreelandella jeotgali TaxID=553386 RepID=UPI0003453822|nr:DEAD/DEAH box helicase family protein [Halomonas jeotgali]